MFPGLPLYPPYYVPRPSSLPSLLSFLSALPIMFPGLPLCPPYYVPRPSSLPSLLCSQAFLSALPIMFPGLPLCPPYYVPRPSSLPSLLCSQAFLSTLPMRKCYSGLWWQLCNHNYAMVAVMPNHMPLRVVLSLCCWCQRMVEML